MALAGDNRLASYFVVVGLDENPTPYEEVSDDAVKQKYKLKPITDIIVINRDEGEEVPPGYITIEHTPSGLDADLNHGSLRAPRMHICYKRGTHKPPLTEIGVIFEGKEQPMDGCTVIENTPYGRSANVNNSTKERTFLVFRRAATLSASELYAVTEIEVLNKTRGDRAPHCFLEIPKSLNRAMIGSEMLLCYRKAPVRWNTIAYRPAVVSRYPLADYADLPLPPSVALFCLPLGVTIEAWPLNYTAPASPTFSTFVLTSDVQRKLYGASIDFYESFDSRRLTQEQRLHLGLELRACDLVQSPDVTSANQNSIHQKLSTAEHNDNEPRLMRAVCRKSICILSAYPCFDAFRDFLRFLHKVVTSSSTTALRIERYVTFFINNVLLPSAAKRRILLQLSPVDLLRVELPFERPIEVGGASFRRLLMNLGAENCVELFTLVLLEQKVLIHSLMRSEVTPVCEALRAMTFPCAWQCVYIPLCPPGIANEITAGSSFDDFLGMPNPFIVGVDSRSFDYFTPPEDVICVDIDTRAILRSGEKRVLTSAKLLPKRAHKQLRSALDELFQQLLADDERQRYAAPRRAALLDPLAVDEESARRQRKEFGVELLIQQAFVRCMCTLLRGYKQFFKPIVCAPTLDTASNLFDADAFVRSREKADARFYQLLTRTQMFTRFVEECSFTSDPVLRSALAFFDECAARAEISDNGTSGSTSSGALKMLRAASNASLLGTPTLGTMTSHGSGTHLSKMNASAEPPRRDSVALDGGVFLSLFALDLRAEPCETTVFLSAPEPDSDAPPLTYSGFPTLDVVELRAAERRAPHANAHADADAMNANARLLVIRDKQELRHSQRHAEDAFALSVDDDDDETDGDEPGELSAKARVECLLYHAYAVWFAHLPAYASLVPQAARRSTLTHAYNTLFSLHEQKRFIVADQVCHRVLMLLCGRYQEPRLAVRTLERMRSYVEPNAITYACYNRTLFECRWDSDSHVTTLWRRLRLVINAAARFRMPLKRKTRRTAQSGADRSYPTAQSDASKRKRSSGVRSFDHRRSASIASTLLLPPPAVAYNEDEASSFDASLSVCSLELLSHHIAVSSSDSLPTESSVDKHSANWRAQQADVNTANVEAPHASAPPLQSAPEPATCKPADNNESLTTLTQQTNTDSAVFLRRSAAGAGTVPKRNRISLQIGGQSPRLNGRHHTLTGTKCIRSPGHASRQTESRILQVAAPRFSGEKPCCSSHGMLIADNSAAGILMTCSRAVEKSARRNVASADSAIRIESKDSALQRVVPPNSQLRMLLETSSGVPIGTDTGRQRPTAPQEQSDLHGSYLNKLHPSSSRQPSVGATSSLPATPVAPGDAEPDTETARSASLRSAESGDGESANNSSRWEWADSLKQKFNSNVKLVNSALVNAVRHTLEPSSSPPHASVSTCSSGLVPSALACDLQAQKLAEAHSAGAGAGDGDGALKPAARLSDAQLEPVAVRACYTADSGYVDDASIQHFLDSSSPSHTRNDATTASATASSKTQQSWNSNGGTKRTAGRIVLVEVDVCSVSRCETCQLLLYDEEIMSGWLSDDSNLRTCCQFCETPTVPCLHVVVRDRRAVVTEQLRSAMRQTPERNDCKPRVRQLEPISVPFLSSLVLRKELETVIASESELSLARPSFADKHPILFWNLIYMLKRLALPTHLSGFVLFARILTGTTLDRDRPASSDTIEPRLLYDAAQYVHVRLLWDNPHLLPVSDAYRPFYYILKRHRLRTRPIADTITDRAESIAAAVRSALSQKQENVRSCIELLIHERERVQNELAAEAMRADASTANANEQVPAAVAGISYTLTKRSIYREILFLLMADLGSRRIDLDAYDTKYTTAFNELAVVDKNRLLPNDAPPLTINRLFRRAFSPKPLELS